MIWVVVVGVVVVLIALIGLLSSRQLRSRRLKARFGPEYDRALAHTGDQHAAERELLERRQRHQQFELRPLDPAIRGRFGERWQAAQRHFIDEPVVAVAEADDLVRQAMQGRGYPVDEDFERRAADLSVDHPTVVDNYRAAHAISIRARRGQATTEELRQSMVHFRALFDELLTASDSTRGRSASRV